MAIIWIYYKPKLHNTWVTRRVPDLMMHVVFPRELSWVRKGLQNFYTRVTTPRVDQMHLEMLVSPSYNIFISREITARSLS